MEPKTARQQQGFSMLAIMLFIAIGVFVLTVVVRVVPVYVEDFTLSSIIGSLEDSRPYREAETVGDVRELLRKRIQMENIDGVEVDDIAMERDGERLLLEFSYEVRSPFMGNIDTVIQFDHQHELRMP
ncbi:DUF4845 domain-containing protein [Vreelandella utahensis]|uniref:DUF4845 domain-containing protein n=1 Tax=Vreelandella halophila TaxID=86177 RepID=UPI00098657D5|nr:DUF4845 domain-containing protein [Halomonas utahensis]